MVASIRPIAAWSARAARMRLTVLPLALTVALAGCGDTSIGSSFMNFMPGTKPTSSPADNQADKDPGKFAATPTCPGAEIRYGTESLNIYEPNKPNAPDTVKYQINVQRVARDCDSVGDQIVARVGVAGLVVGGLKGVAGKVEIPVRIAAVNGDKVLYTGLKTVSVNVEAPDFNASWSVVDDAVTIPANVSNETIIYVGIDSKSKPPGAEADDKPHPHKPKPAARSAQPSGDDPYPQMKPHIAQ